MLPDATLSQWMRHAPHPCTRQQARRPRSTQGMQCVAQSVSQGFNAHHRQMRIDKNVCARVRAYARAPVSVYVRVRICACASLCAYSCTHACTRICVCACSRTYWCTRRSRRCCDTAPPDTGRASSCTRPRLKGKRSMETRCVVQFLDVIF